MIFKKMTMLMEQDGAGTGAGTGEAAKGTTGAGDTQTKAEPKSITGEPAADGRSITGTEGKSGEEKGAAKPEGEKGVTDLKLKLPEGMDEKAAEPHMAIFKKHGLKSEVAQEIFDHVLKHGAESRTSFEKEIASNWAKTQEQWLDEAKKDPEIGGDKFKPSVALADKFVQKIGGDALAEVFIRSGLGKNVTVLKALAKAGKMISEDSIDGTIDTSGKGETKTEKARLKAEFPNSPSMWQHLPD